MSVGAEQIRALLDKRTQGRVLNRQLGLENLKRHSFENATRGLTKGNQSVRSGSVEDERLNDGKPTLIPFFYDNKVVDAKEAVERALESGRVWPSFDTNKEATAASRSISDKLGAKK